MSIPLPFEGENVEAILDGVWFLFEIANFTLCKNTFFQSHFWNFLLFVSLIDH